MDVMIFFILLALIFGFILGFLIYKAVSKGEVLERAEEKAKEFFDRQKEELKASIERDYEARFENWKREAEKAIKVKTLETSRASLKGKIGEQMAPLLPIFEYNPADARFIGSPIDYVIFDRYTDVKDRNTDDLITIIFMDVKTGKNAHLNLTQKKIKEAVESGRIKWKTLFLGDLSKFGSLIKIENGYAKKSELSGETELYINRINKGKVTFLK